MTRKIIAQLVHLEYIPSAGHWSQLPMALRDWYDVKNVVAAAARRAKKYRRYVQEVLRATA